MSFSSNVPNGFFFKLQSDLSLNRATVNFDKAYPLLARPYYDLSSNVKAVAHPFFHAMQLLRDAARFAYGAFLLAGALITLNFSCADRIAAGMLELVLAATIETLNIALSVISLATRLLASIFNLGYVSTRVEIQGAHLNGAEIGGRNEETTRNV